ncbi:unnamed protein product, partial [marine sediment metagenome]
DSFSFQYVANFAEWWDGIEQNTQATDTMQAVRAYKQIGLEGGALMHESLLRPTGEATDDTLGMILTVFTNPIMWRGWNRLVSYVIDSDIASRVVTSTKVLQQEADVNKLIGSQVTGTVEHIFAPPRVVVQPLTETTAYYNAVVITDQTGNVKITDGLYFEQRNECPNPVMLDWINSVGGIESHLFTINQVVDTEVDEGIVSETPIDGDFADVTRTKRRFRGPYIQRMTLFADDLTRDQLNGLAQIKQTESLRCYLSKDGTAFVDVVVVNEAIVIPFCLSLTSGCALLGCPLSHVKKPPQVTVSCSAVSIKNQLSGGPTHNPDKSFTTLFQLTFIVPSMA